ncbi:MAG: heavy metal translocating P-type ATPase, partial [Candidatus Ranarchaeia archaeon]
MGIRDHKFLKEKNRKTNEASMMQEHIHSEQTETGCPVCGIDETDYSLSIWSDKRLYIIIISGALLLTGLVFEFMLGLGLAAALLFLVTAFVSGFDIAKGGVSALISKKRLNIDFLITVAAIGSFFIGHGEEGAAVVFLFYVAEFLEGHASQKAKRSVMALMQLAPEIATIKKDGKELQVHVHDVNVQDVFVVRPGEKIPLDGRVIKGTSSVNQAPITGESVPVLKRVDDEVYAGTINNEGFLEGEVTKRSDQTTLAKIVKLVEDAQKIKSPTEKFIDKFAKYYTPTVIFLAVIVATVPSLVFGLPFEDWLYKALVLLVISCPCALAISTPVAMVSGITSAAKNGVLIKGSAYVEEVSKVKVFAFDKTGTITEGRLVVTDVLAHKVNDEELLTYTASIEALSEHPIAKAIVDEALKRGLKLESVEDFAAIVGKGATGRI